MAYRVSNIKQSGKFQGKRSEDQAFEKPEDGEGRIVVEEGDWSFRWIPMRGFRVSSFVLPNT